MPTSLLAHIASNFITQYENVANASVCYLLNEYPAARAALAGLLGVEEVPNHYTAEEATQSGSRPDITGRDANGEKTVLIEGKFWANLTDNQPNDYLRELAEGGRLLFLAPERRTTSLTAELQERSCKDTRVHVCSWHRLLTLVQEKDDGGDDSPLAGDLHQLKALCDKMDAEGMPPLSPSDLDPMHGRITTQLADVIDDCAAVLRGKDYADFSGLRKTNTKHRYGSYFVAHKRFGAMLFFARDHWYRRDQGTPIWLSVVKAGGGYWDTDRKINDALRAYDPKNFHKENELGILLKPGLDKDQVVNHIVCRAEEILAHLNDKVGRS